MKIKIKETYLLILIVIGLVSLSVYTTYAMFTTSTEIANVVDFTASLGLSSNVTEYNLITLPAGETMVIELHLTNSYTGTLYYGAWYQMSSGNSNNLTIGINADVNSNLSTGTINANASVDLLVGMTNDGSTDMEIALGVAASLTSDLEITDATRIIIPNTWDDSIVVDATYLASHSTTVTENVNENITVNEGENTAGTYDYTLYPGTYELKVWGASGGYGYSTTYAGGTGGYSYGTLTLTSTTTVYAVVGGAGNPGTTTKGIKEGGSNGGGASGYVNGGSGGGGSDIRIGTNSLYARVIVAGGGGGGGYYSGSTGGYGGGTSGNAGGGYSSTYSSYWAQGGTATSGGAAGGYTSAGTTYKGTAGTFGQGGAGGTATSYTRDGGGGGGWYGGGGGGTNNSSSGTLHYKYYVSGGGGGSGYVYTSSTASDYPSGCLLNSSYYLTDASTINGNTSFTDYDGTTVTGHSGDGAFKITGTGTKTTQTNVTYYTVPTLSGIDTLNISSGSSVNLTNNVTVTCEYGHTGECSLVGASISDTSSLAIGTYTIYYTVNGYDGTKYKYARTLNVSLDASGANSPDLVDGLIPVMYSNGNWVKADSTNVSSTYKWYDYENKQWANAVLVTSTNRSTYQNASAGTTITDADILAFYVWIPRFKYKVWNINKVIETDSYNAETTGIDIVFENGTASTGTISCTYDFTVEEGEGLSETCTGSNGDYYTHPAFTFGSEELRGFWMGKFELSTQNGTVQNYGNSGSVMIVPNAISMRKSCLGYFITKISYMHDLVNDEDVYGLYAVRSSNDPHMITNMEWGAVAYLTNSEYGLCTNGTCTGLGSNNFYDDTDGLYSTYYTTRTGCGAEYTDSLILTETCNTYNTTLGMKASTTGNVYGVYDMSGGAEEFVMSNSSGSSGSYTYQSGHMGGTSYYQYSGNEKYITTYAYGTTSHDQTAYNRTRLGDATGEIISTIGSYTNYGAEQGWYNSDCCFPMGSSPWLRRGGRATNGTNRIFTFYTEYGDSSVYITSRAVLTISS